MLGPDGQPIASAKKEVPFIQWQPGRANIGRMIDRGPDIYAQAASFLKCGGRYAFILRDDGMAEMVAGFPVKGGEPGEMLVVAEQVVPNGPAVGPAVDRLVVASLANLPAVTATLQ